MIQSIDYISTTINRLTLYLIS